MSPEGFSMSIPLLDGAVAAVYPFVADLAAAVTPVGAIVLCTAALRLLLLPLTRAAVRGDRSRAALARRVPTGAAPDAGVRRLVPHLHRAPDRRPGQRPAGSPVPRGGPVRPPAHRRPPAGVPAIAGTARAAGLGSGAAGPASRDRHRYPATTRGTFPTALRQPACRTGHAAGRRGVPGHHLDLDGDRKRGAAARPTGTMTFVHMCHPQPVDERREHPGCRHLRAVRRTARIPAPRRQALVARPAAIPLRQAAGSWS